MSFYGPKALEFKLTYKKGDEPVMSKNVQSKTINYFRVCFRESASYIMEDLLMCQSYNRKILW
nr:MAG TPA: hypothetical protein [Caudoviricetes sp.]